MSVREPETDRLARELAALTGESMTQAIREALKERLARERKRRRSKIERRRAAINAIVERAAALPVLDERPEDEILGYDEQGPNSLLHQNFVAKALTAALRRFPAMSWAGRAD